MLRRITHTISNNRCSTIAPPHVFFCCKLNNDKQECEGGKIKNKKNGSKWKRVMTPCGPWGIYRPKQTHVSGHPNSRNQCNIARMKHTHTSLTSMQNPRHSSLATWQSHLMQIPWASTQWKCIFIYLVKLLQKVMPFGIQGATSLLLVS